MAWLRKAFAQLALSRSPEALVKASGGEPRTVRGVTLDPRMQYLEARARRNPTNWETATPDLRRAQSDALSELYGGARVGKVRRERIYITGRSHSVPGRLYLPVVRDNSAAMLVYYHAGGGVVGSLESCDRLCGLIARMAGAPVLSVEYRLAPEHKFPAGLDDARTAYLWTVENAARFGAPVRKAGIAGDSIGAAFATAIAQQMKQTNGPQPVVQTLIYPLVDLVSDTPSMHDFADAWPLTADLFQFLMRHYLPEHADPSDPHVSPGRAQDLSGLPPALVYTAGFDMLLDQGEAYAQRLAEAGVKVKLTRFETLPHAFVMYPAATPAAEKAVRRIAQETADALKGKF